MTEKEYYVDLMGYLCADGYYRGIQHLWQGTELFQDLKSLFGSSKAAAMHDVKSSYALYKDLPYLGRGSITPLLLLKQIDAQRYIVIQRDEAIVITQPPVWFDLDNCTPARCSGYVECAVTVPSAEGIATSTSLQHFSKAASSQRENMNFHACMQIKVIADFFRAPWKMDVHGDV